MIAAILSARSRTRSAALRIRFERSKAEVADQTAKPRAAAASARSSSSRPAWATRPMTASVAGFTTSMVFPVEESDQDPSIRSFVSG